MKLLNLTKVWVCRAERVNLNGEPFNIYHYKGIAYLSLQQDLNELDKNSAGIVDHETYKGRTDKNYDIINTDGICLTDISKSKNIIPDYIVAKSPKIGRTTTYTLNKYNGDFEDNED